MNFKTGKFSVIIFLASAGVGKTSNETDYETEYELNFFSNSREKFCDELCGERERESVEWEIVIGRAADLRVFRTKEFSEAR